MDFCDYKNFFTIFEFSTRIVVFVMTNQNHYINVRAHIIIVLLRFGYWNGPHTDPHALPKDQVGASPP